MTDPPPFSHLSVRSCYSLRDGAIRPRELAGAAAAAGMTHVAVTDRDGLYGAVRFAEAARKEGVTPVFGADLALVGDPDRPGWELTRAGRRRFDRDEAARARERGHAHDPRTARPSRGPAWLEDDAARVTILARTTTGYGDLCRAVTAAHGTFDPAPDHDRSAPHLSWDGAAAAAAHDATVVLHGVDSPVGRLIAQGRMDAADDELRRWLGMFGRRGTVLAVRNHLTPPGGRGRKDPDEPGDDVRIARTLELADRLGLTAIATNDVRYLHRGDAPLADVLTCVRHQVPLGDRHVGRVSAEGWFKPSGEMARMFSERPDLLRAAHDLATTCEVDLGIGQVHVPRLTGLADEVAAGELHRRAWQGVGERFTRVTPRVRERLEAELDMVDRLGLHDYFLSVADIVAAIRGSGVIAACRGSAAGSLICYALRISDVDPVAHDLAFERFMNPYRDELPDIDVDVESARREDIYDLVLARYGEDRTACVAMVETFQARMGIREVGKALGLPAEEIGLVAKSFTHARARDVKKALARLPELKNLRIDAGQLERLFTIVERIDGFPRHLALHPCGILLADTSLMDRTPLERSASRTAADGTSHPGYAMSQFDKDDVAALGLLKLDVLSVRMLSSMRHCLALVPHTRGHSLEVDDIPHEDPDTYELIRSTRSIGIFQIESPGQQELLGRLQPDHLGDLITEISLFRPGPVKADMITPFVARRHGHEDTVYAHPSLEPVLADTHGVIVYHEQVMGVLCALTGCDMSYADLLRRQLSDDDKLATLRGWALARAVDRGFSREDAERIWDQVASFASFGFCKAHAAAFAVPTYRSAYLKTHYFPEFMAGLLTHDPGMYPRRLILDECRTFGVAVLPPDVNRSEGPYTVEVVDQGLADHLLGLTGERLPPGWTAAAGHRPVPPSRQDLGDAGHGYRYAVRVGLQDVKGITAGEVDSLTTGRPFTSLGDVRSRSRLSRPVAERLARAGAFDHLVGVGRRSGPRDRREVVLAVEALWRKVRRGRDPDEPEQTTLDLHADHELMLPPPSEARQVRDELATTGLDVTRHVVSFYEPLLEALGVVRAVDLDDLPHQAQVRVAGVKVAVQSPAQRSGQRVIFLSLDDRTGTTQSTFFERSLDDNAWTLLHAWLVVVEGRVSKRGSQGRGGMEEGVVAGGVAQVGAHEGDRAATAAREHARRGSGGAATQGEQRPGATRHELGVPSRPRQPWGGVLDTPNRQRQRGATVVGQRAWDLSRLWRAWQEGWLADALDERGTPKPHERQITRPAGLQASEFGRGSR